MTESQLANEQNSSREFESRFVRDVAAATAKWVGEPVLVASLQEALDVRRIAQKAGQELSAAKLSLIQAAGGGESRGVRREAGTSEKAERVSRGFDNGFVPSVIGGDRRPESAMPVMAAEAVERVRMRFEPPPPPPVARQVSLEIGDADSQVNVVIRERNGDLAIQFGAATERLRDNLQNAAPQLLHQLQREATQASSVQLDFSSFGSATESGRNPHDDRREKKALKSGADFAALAEVTGLSEAGFGEKALGIPQLRA